MNDTNAYEREAESSLANRAWRALLRARTMPVSGDIVLCKGRRPAMARSLLEAGLYAQTGVNKFLLDDDRPKLIVAATVRDRPVSYALLAPTGGRYTAAPLPRRIAMLSVYTDPDHREQGHARRVVAALGAVLDDCLSPAIARDAVLVGEARILDWARPLLPLPVFARHNRDRDWRYASYVSLRRRIAGGGVHEIPSFAAFKAELSAS